MNGQDDYRIKVCGQLSEQVWKYLFNLNNVFIKEFIQSHRLMAKLYYQYGSRHQPILLRDAPNPRQLFNQSLKDINFQSKLCISWCFQCNSPQPWLFTFYQNS